MRFVVYDMRRSAMSRRGATGVLVAVVISVAACDALSPSPATPPTPTGSVTDVEGIYPTIVIGKQEWMVENLKTATYNDGTPIPNVTDADTWANLSLSGAYAWYDNDDVANKDLYGALYNFFAVSTGKLCPTGWAMPSRDNWGALTDSLGGGGVAGGPMKEPGTAHWQAPNAGATNLSGFSALPGGRRYIDGSFDSLGLYALWWTSEDKLISLPATAYFWDATYQLASSGGAEAQVTNGPLRALLPQRELTIAGSPPSMERHREETART